MPPLTLDGTNGVSAVQAGAVESGDLPAGSVIQVVSNVYSTLTTISSTTYVNSGLSASITPANVANKILCCVALSGRVFTAQNDDRIYFINLVRGSTEVAYKTAKLQGGLGSAGFIVYPIPDSIIYLDSPGVTSSLTYKIQLKTSDTASSTSLELNSAPSGGDCTITLMEIAG